MDSGKIIAVLCLVVVLVVAVNGFLILAFRQRGTLREIELLRQASKTARDPWGREDAALEELSRLVEELKQPDLDEETADSEA